MVVQVQTLYHTPSREHGIVETFRDHCPDYKVPEQTVVNEIASLVQSIEKKENFDPNLKFNPAKHIIFNPESYKSTKKFTLQDLNIHKTHVKPINDFGAVFPFKLLSQEAVDMLLWEAFQPAIIEQHARLPNLATQATRLDFHIGDHIHKSPFTESLTKSKELTTIVSNFVGYKMKPVWDSDFVHINVSLASTDPREQLTNYPQTQYEIDKELTRQDASDGQDIPSTVGVHYDSITVPLVIMLDLPEEAQGGQTTIITGDNKATRVPEPPIGSGTLIQGRVLRHLASKPVTNHNRISLVLSYATGVEGELDNCVTTSVKPSVLPKNEFNKFYRDWAEYKLTNLENHLKKIREGVVDDYNNGTGFHQEEFVEKCQNIERYVYDIYKEMECLGYSPYPPPLFSTSYNEL
ncbi:hypothetical protein CAS74_004237 [Pichia kudriavzevii]|uniref:Fe2OG dioxygenase domain-containing protein n=2 Tax=Pichia kudriavzevii TaxID=4909 RepID=A0A1Z8JJ07_PICKU|nr:uncharacterized protein C5L36_0A08610 [Pichia kudriavzevii]AWU74264.1 hypothetical protein C5L36_0A08610 [Pichia kudriavzevii]OUT20576.1 hypothetical protein CAS74_004237 [Pichia kudriavzevii]